MEWSSFLCLISIDYMPVVLELHTVQMCLGLSRTYYAEEEGMSSTPTGDCWPSDRAAWLEIHVKKGKF